MALAMLDHLAPINRYVAYCGGQDTLIYGPYRERFLWLAAQQLRDHGHHFIIYEGEIYLNRQRSSTDRPYLFQGLIDYQLNTDSKLAAYVGRGVRLDNVYFPPPSRLVSLVRERGAAQGLSVETGADGLTIQGPIWAFGDDCDLMRAAILPDPAAEPPRPSP